MRRMRPRVPPVLPQPAAGVGARGRLDLPAVRGGGARAGTGFTSTKCQKRKGRKDSSCPKIQKPLDRCLECSV